MSIFSILYPLLFFFLLFLFLQIIKLTLFFVYLVQLKEYRFDRTKAYFKTISGKKHLLNYFNLLKWRQFYRPKFTSRAFLILFLTFITQYNFFFFVLRFFFRFFKNFPNAIIFLLIIALFLLNLIVPLTVFICSFISALFFWPIKKVIILLAGKKIKKAQNLLIIGITGSYGKTAVKEILSFILADFFKVLKTPFNCNTEMGIASLILRKLRRRHEIFIIEMGAYKRGEIKNICNMVSPKIGIITGINEQHLELFGSLSNTQWAKFELIKSLPKDGFAIFNKNNHYVQRLFKSAKIAKKFYGHQRINFKTKLSGGWQKENIQAVLAITDFLKLPRKKVLKRLLKLDNFPLGLKVIEGIKETKIIDDSYSSNPKGFLSALNLLKKMPARKKILITPGIIELGRASAKIHKEIGQKAGRICAKIFLTKPDFKELIKKGLAKNKTNDFLEVEEDQIELLEKLKPFLGKGTVILLEGRLSYNLVKKLCR